jgi:hypothetical protein
MTLGEDIAEAFSELRPEANSRMAEKVSVGIFTDGVADDGAPTRVLAEERYTGDGRIRYGSIAVSDGTAGASQIGQPVVAQTPYLSIPHGSPRLYEGDEVLVTDSTSDDLFVGRTYKVSGNGIVGAVTAHRYPLTELS